MLRVVPDTNVLVSALLASGGSSGVILRLFREGALDFVLSKLILAEIERVLNYPKIQKRTGWNKQATKAFCMDLGSFCILTQDIAGKSMILEDPSDDKFLYCAAAGNADFIISGDIHLLTLKHYKGVEIVSPKEFLARYDI